MLPAAVNQTWWPCSAVRYTKTNPEFEAIADLGMNCGSGSYSGCDLGQVSWTSLSLWFIIYEMGSHEDSRPCLQKYQIQDFPGGTVDKHLPASAGDTSLIPGLGRFHTLAEQQIPWATASETALWKHWTYDYCICVAPSAKPTCPKACARQQAIEIRSSCITTRE